MKAKQCLCYKRLIPSAEDEDLFNLWHVHPPTACIRQVVLLMTDATIH